eukprot:SAG11_NODE_9565_length_900_cov_1.026217_1_plen_235_part_10
MLALLSPAAMRVHLVTAAQPSTLIPAGDLTSWLRQHPLQPGTTLFLEPGDHTLSETLHFGSDAAGLKVSGAAGARITGGFAIPAGAWEMTFRGNLQVLSARLPPGTWAPGADPPRQLWTNNGQVRRTRARHPNLWNDAVTAVADSPYMYWAQPLETDFGGTHCNAHACKPPCRNQSICDAAKKNRHGFRYNESADGELMHLLSSGNCSQAPPPGQGYCAGLEAIVYHGWTVSRSF